MNRRLLPFALIFSMTACTAQGADEQAALMMRVIRKAQDELVFGKPHREAVLQSALSHLGSIVTGDDFDLAENEKLAIEWLLSGGDAGMLNQSKVGPDGGSALFRGVVALSNGDADAAYNLLHDIDPLRLEPSMAGLIALVIGNLAEEHDVDQAAAMYRVARLLSPGSAVEELALRREMQIAGDTPDVDAFGRLARRYFQIFRRAPQASQVHEMVVGRSDHVFDTLSEDRLAQARNLFLLAGDNAWPSFCVAEARRLLFAGRIGPARRAAEEAAAATNVAANGIAMRARLYLAAATLGEDSFHEHLAALRACDLSGLTETERLLADALDGMDQTMVSSGDELINVADASEPDPNAAISEAVSRALAQADTALTRNRK